MGCYSISRMLFDCKQHLREYLDWLIKIWYSQFVYLSLSFFFYSRSKTRDVFVQKT